MTEADGVVNDFGDDSVPFLAVVVVVDCIFAYADISDVTNSHCSDNLELSCKVFPGAVAVNQVHPTGCCHAAVFAGVGYLHTETAGALVHDQGSGLEDRLHFPVFIIEVVKGDEVAE